MINELTINQNEIKLIKAALIQFKYSLGHDLEIENDNPRYQDPYFQKLCQEGTALDYRKSMKELILRTNELLDKIDS